MRNDYGYALLLVGRYQDAAFELRTALELANGQGPVRQNVAVAYLLVDDTAGLAALTQALLDAGLTEDQIAKVMGGNMMRYLAETLPDG